jgi:AcrR family transcriptional regulator
VAVKRGNGHRGRQAEATKQQIARAARALFAERGYVATTISAISHEADIPVPTIYSAFGTKAKILDKITEIWMREAQTVSIAAASLREPDSAKQLRMLAELNRRQLQVGSDVVATYQEAARSDPQMAETMRNVLASREREIRKLVGAVADQLKPGLTVEGALDITLALTLPEIYQSLVVERGWSGQRYETWLGEVLVDQLLAD